jgi:hypothetical protein
MSRIRNNLTLLTALLIASATSASTFPSFHSTAKPEGWAIVEGEVATGMVVQARNAGAVQLRTTAPVTLPVEATFRFRAVVGDSLTFQATTNNAHKGQSLLNMGFILNKPNSCEVRASGSNAKPLAGYINYGGWRYMGGRLTYSWRFQKVKNFWDERDRREIGADYAKLVPFNEKVFTLRMVLTGATRQIWLDDRLLGEERVSSPAKVEFSFNLTKTAQVLSAEFRRPKETGPYVPLALTSYSHARDALAIKPKCELERLPGEVPMWVPETPQPDIDLGKSLFRYRLTHGAGPNAEQAHNGYVDALHTWHAAFHVDPASLKFRVPYRHYQNVWLLAWLDDRPDAVPSGTLRFFRELAGYPAESDFEINEAAIKKGFVTKLNRNTHAGKALYLVRVPVDTVGLRGQSDDAHPYDIGKPRGSTPLVKNQFFDFELSKPVAPMRGYPDPIYYGSHPAGRPSSVHVIGITLEEASFGYDVRPAEVGHVFERPQKPSYDIVVTNTTDQPMTARVSLQTHSFDGEEEGGAGGRVNIPARGTGTVNLDLDLKKLGWHELRVDVNANDQNRKSTLALVLLPPNTRTYGYATNEIRFGTWQLGALYTPFGDSDEKDDALLAMYRKIGIRRSNGPLDLLKRNNIIPTGTHTIGSYFVNAFHEDGTVNPEEMAKGVSNELASVARRGSADFPEGVYFYGAEWNVSKEISYAPWPRYTGDGDREFTAKEQETSERHVKIFTAVGRALREHYPQLKLALNWGAPFNAIAYMRAGMPKDLVDMYGMDQPQFEQLPEISNIHGAINWLWAFHEETKHSGWPRLPMNWCEGPFFPTNPGALTESEQADYQIRYWLMALAYGVEHYDAGIVMDDAGGYYGAEHYGAGLFHRRPLEHPKPSIAAVANMTSMICGADVVGPVDTGSLTDYCLAFKRANEETKIYALWRVNGTVDATIKVRGTRPMLIDSMGNATELRVKDGAVTVNLSSSPVWLTGVKQIDGFALAAPQYSEIPAKITRPLAAMTVDQWSYDGAEDKAYAYNHFAIRRIPDPNLKAEFGQGEEGYPDAVAITLPVEPGDRPLATRYGQLRLRKPVVIPGNAQALGIWIKGNSSWGRVVYQCNDAEGEVWTSVGTKDDWNCDDTHAWSYVSFEGWRYIRFPLPSNRPYDSFRELESTWWGSRDGDGIVDLPLSLTKIIVEARNEVPVVGEMKIVPDRSYKLAGLVAEYDTEENATDTPVADSKIRMPLPEWKGPDENQIVKLAAEGVGTAPTIKAFNEPPHFNDGRRMIIRFDQDPALTYKLYIGRYPDGRGAELLVGEVKDKQLVTGLRPEMSLYMFLTATNAEKKESKPSTSFELVTHDNFAEK